MSNRSGLLVKMDVLSGALRVASMLRYLHESTAATIKLASEALAEGHAELSRKCLWSLDTLDGYWRGSCGIVWQCESDNPAENGMNFCPRCGAKLETQQSKELT